MAASAAAALDAADGVIDGKYYGRDIVTVPSRSYGYQTYSQVCLQRGCGVQVPAACDSPSLDHCCSECLV